MHGTKLCDYEHRTFRLSAPRPAVFPACRINASRHAAVFLVSQPGPETRSGLSLAHNRFRLRGLHSGVKDPGLLLRVPAPQFTSPFGCSLHRPCQLAPHRLLRCESPLPVRYSVRSAFRRSPLPVGIFRSLWIKAFYRLRTDRPVFHERPISSRSPFSFLLTSFENGSSFLVRYVPETCCSSNLLEPPSLCAQVTIGSRKFREFRLLFINILPIEFSSF
jgi:hypothetical protein